MLMFKINYKKNAQKLRTIKNLSIKTKGKVDRIDTRQISGIAIAQKYNSTLITEYTCD